MAQVALGLVGGPVILWANSALQILLSVAMATSGEGWAWGGSVPGQIRAGPAVRRSLSLLPWELFPWGRRYGSSEMQHGRQNMSVVFSELSGIPRKWLFSVKTLIVYFASALS